MKKFEFLEHPADIKIRSYGKDLPELFINSALGMMTFLYENVNSIQTTQEETIEVEAEDLESLLVNWLSELLCDSDTHHRCFIKFKILFFSNTKLIAKAEVGNAIAQDDIKAVTYHDLKIIKEDNGWNATVIYDI